MSVTVLAVHVALLAITHSRLAGFDEGEQSTVLDELLETVKVLCMLLSELYSIKSNLALSAVSRFRCVHDPETALSNFALWLYTESRRRGCPPGGRGGGKNP